MQVADGQARHRNFVSAYTARRPPHPLSDRSGQEQITLMMQPYKGYVIEGSALLVHPFSPD
jgi:hypothetical protein